MSEKQSDRLCDVISQPTEGLDRSPIRELECGKYIFFGGTTTNSGNPLGRSKNSRATPASAYAGASGNHEIHIGRPGTYSVGEGALTLNKAVTLRATLAGPFTIH